MNTQWFTTEIIGAAFAGADFARQFNILPNQQLYSLQQLREFFPDKVDTVQLLALLEHMDLAHKTEDDQFLLPGKLPDGLDIEWDPKAAYGIRGISIECDEKIDIFNPNVFPSVQKKLLDEHKGSTCVSHSAVKCVVGSVEVLAQFAKHRQAINVAAIFQDENSMKAAYNSLMHVVDLIESDLHEKSPGTNFHRGYLSQAALCQHTTNIDDVWSYKEEDIVTAEEKGVLVMKEHGSKPEEITNILFKGYDKLMLRRFGQHCRYEWLPSDVVERCFGPLDVRNKWGEDYRAVARALSIPEHKVEKLTKESESQLQSITSRLIREWCSKSGARMTIGVLQTLLKSLSLEDNADALKVIEEVIETYSVRTIL